MDWAASLGTRRIDLAFETPFAVGGAWVDPRAHEIVWAGQSRRVQPQTLKVLVALHDSVGETVTREELIDRCWDGRIVTDDVVNRCISALRRIVAEIGGAEIQTVPKGGYRLLTKTPDGKGQPATAQVAARPRRGLLWIGGGAAVAALLAVVLAVSSAGRQGQHRAIVQVETLAAAPGDPSARALSEGLRSSIEHDLAGSGASVALTDGEQGGNSSLKLRGSTISEDGQLRASLELVSGRSGEIIWASNFDGPLDRLDDLREQLSLQIARELHCAYSEGRGRYFDTDIEFAKLTLAHCDSLGKDTDDSVRLDAQIVQRAPALARAWSEYAIDSAFAAEDLPPLTHRAGERRAIALAHHALALDPHQGLAYTGIGVAIEDTASWADSERLARSALVADPKSPEAHNWQSGLLAGIGRLQEALNEAKISYSLDHFLPGKIDQLIRINIASGNLDDAVDELALGRRNWPGIPWWDRDAIYLGVAGSNSVHALQLLDAHKVRMSAAEQNSLAAFLRWRIAHTAASARLAKAAIQKAAADEGPTSREVELLAMLGDLDGAYGLAGRLPPKAGPALYWFSPGLSSFRDDPRFMSLAARIGLAKIWLQTDQWPDFCDGAGRLESCRAEAATAAAGTS